MSNTSKNVESNTTLKRAKLDAIDLVHIKICMEESIKSAPNSTLNKDYEKTLEKVKALIQEDIQEHETYQIKRIYRKSINDLTLGNIATILDINDRKSNNIHGLDYYYGDGMIGAYVPKPSCKLAYAWENAQDFMKSHNMSLVEYLQVFNPREYMK